MERMEVGISSPNIPQVPSWTIWRANVHPLEISPTDIIRNNNLVNTELEIHREIKKTQRCPMARGLE